jgi:magnesium-transporting ATPase (P-type)
MNPRPVIVTVVAVMQTVMAVVSVLAVMLLAWQNHSLPPGSTPEETQAIHMGLRIAIWSAVVCAVITLAVSWAMWKQRRWGWWLGLVFYLLILLAMLYGPVVDGDPVDTDDMTIAAVFLLLAVSLLIPPVRRFYLSRGKAAEGSAS